MSCTFLIFSIVHSWSNSFIHIGIYQKNSFLLEIFQWATFYGRVKKKEGDNAFPFSRLGSLINVLLLGPICLSALASIILEDPFLGISIRLPTSKGKYYVIVNPICIYITSWKKAKVGKQQNTVLFYTMISEQRSTESYSFQLAKHPKSQLARIIK